jgi:hypothetical protein
MVVLLSKSGYRPNWPFDNPKRPDIGRWLYMIRISLIWLNVVCQIDLSDNCGSANGCTFSAEIDAAEATVIENELRSILRTFLVSNFEDSRMLQPLSAKVSWPGLIRLGWDLLNLKLC